MTLESPTITMPKRYVDKKVLDNGTTLLYTPNPYNQIVAIRILSRMASSREEGRKAGLANLTARLLSAGTDHHTEDQIAIQLEQNGAHFKAEAGKDSSAIDLLTTTHFLRDDLNMVLELLDCPSFPEEKLTREREIVRMNIMEQEDSLLNFTLRKFRQHFFGDHPYSWPNIGLIETIDNIQRDDLVHFAHAAFDPSQLVISVVGGPENGEVERIVSEGFAHRPSREFDEWALPEPIETTFAENRDTIDRRQSESEYLVIGYNGPSIKMPDAIPMRLVSAVLGGSMDSRLFREIREQRGLCYQVGSSYSPMHDRSPLMIYVVTTPQNRKLAVQCAEREVMRMKSEPVPEEELQRVKTYLCGSYVMALESNMGQAVRYASYETSGLGWDYTNRFPEEIFAATAEQMAQTVSEFCTQRLLTITAPTAD